MNLMGLTGIDEWQIYSFFFVFIRVCSILFFLPLFGDRTIAVSIKILFGFALSVMVYPVLGAGILSIPALAMQSASHTILAVISEVLLGILIGFVSRWVFDAVQFAGHFIGTSIGFSMASVLDPHSETQTISIAELHYILAALLFLAFDGHHIFFTAILDSFEKIPMGRFTLFGRAEEIVKYLMEMSAHVISLGVRLAAPSIVVILLTNLTFSVLAKAVSQMNLLVLTFTANVLIGVIVVLVSLPGFLNVVENAFTAYTPEIFKFMRLLGG